MKVVLIRAEGRTFCAGADLSEASSEGMEQAAGVIVELQRRIVTLSKPVVVRAHGHVRAGGIGIVAAADVAVSSLDATYAFTEVRLGLTPAAISLTVVPRMTDRAAALTFLTGEVFDGREAERTGLVTRAVPEETELDLAVEEVCAALAKGHPQGLRETKQLVGRHLVERIDRARARAGGALRPAVRVGRGEGGDARVPGPEEGVAQSRPRPVSTVAPGGGRRGAALRGSIEAAPGARAAPRRAVMRQGSVRSDVEEFVVARSDRLLRTAYLLSGDPDRAEDLLQDALAEAWADWDHNERDPDAAVRSAMVRLYAGWWPAWRRGLRRSAVERDPAGLWRLPRAQRAVVVLRHAEHLDAADTAEALGVATPTVERLEARALASLATPDPAPALADLAGGLRDTHVGDRLSQVERRKQARRAVRRAELVGGLVVALVAGFVLAGALTPSPAPDRGIPDERLVEAPPRLAGRQLPVVVRRRNQDFLYARSAEGARGENPFTLTIAADRDTQALAWASTTGLRGRIVVSVDGTVVRRAPAGRLTSALLVSGRRTHIVVLEATRPRPTMRLGVAVYRLARP